MLRSGSVWQRPAGRIFGSLAKSESVDSLTRSMSSLSGILQSNSNAMMEALGAEARRKSAAVDAQIALPALLSGAATFTALNAAVEQLVSVAPKDHDVLIVAFDIQVHEVRFLQPHSFLFRGLDSAGNHTSVVAHFSQMVARVVYLPPRGPDRVITGFTLGSERG